MGLDPSIYAQLDTQGPVRLAQMLTQGSDPMAAAQKAMAIKSMMGQQQMQEMQMRQAMRQEQQQNALEDISRQFGADPVMMRQKLIEGGHWKEATAIDKQRMEAEEKAANIGFKRSETSAKDLDAAIKAHEAAANAIGSVTDQAGYDRMRIGLGSQNPLLAKAVDTFPKLYTPQAVAQLADEVRSQKDRLDQARQMMNTQSEIAHRANQDKTAQGQLGVSMQRLNMDAQTAGQQKAPPGYRFVADGSLQAIPGGPADQKAQVSVIGKQTVSEVVSSLRGTYEALDKSGGVTNPDKSTLENVMRGSSSSEAGQFVGRLAGTQNQSLRNTIAQQRPLLLQAIMKATGMSAKQMDSNVELKLYLSTATDPTLDIKANLRALEMIDKLYGVGATSGSAEPAPSQKPAAAQSLPNIVTLADVRATARASGVPVEKVMADLEARGVKVR